MLLDSVNTFYSKRSACIEYLFAGTKQHKRLMELCSVAHDKLTESLTEEQKRLYGDVDECVGDLRSYEETETYKAGFLEGFAIGVMSATHHDAIADADRSAYNAGLKDGRNE